METDPFVAVSERAYMKGRGAVALHCLSPGADEGREAPENTGHNQPTDAGRCGALTSWTLSFLKCIYVLMYLSAFLQPL